MVENRIEGVAGGVDRRKVLLGPLQEYVDGGRRVFPSGVIL